MKILGDSNITAADLTATNIISLSQTDKLKTFALADNMRTLANNTIIDITFNGDIPDIDTLALCGTNLTPTAVIELSYSDTDIESPDDTITLPLFSTLHQVFFLDEVLNKKYWRVSISDPSLDIIFIGYIYTGVSLEIPFVEFGMSPNLEIFSNSNVTTTGQGYGGKLYNAIPVDFTLLIGIELLKSYLAIKQEKQNIDPVFIVAYTESYNIDIYRPTYGPLTGTQTPYPLSKNNLKYSVSDRQEERF